MAIPAYILDQPGVPKARAGGLLDSATVLPMPEKAQTSGGQWWSEGYCGGVHPYNPVCATPPYPAFTMDAEDGLIQAYPFVLYASEICTPVGNDYERAAGVVRNRFTIGEAAGLEAAFWGGNSGAGVTGILETLQGAGKVTTLGASATAADGVALLEQQAASSGYHGQTIIHARRMMTPYLAKSGQFRTRLASDGSTVYSWNGSSFSFGDGYSGNTPTGTAPTGTAETMYITGRVLIWRQDDLFISPPTVLDRSLNQRGLYGARAYMIAVECLAAATLTTRA